MRAAVRDRSRARIRARCQQDREFSGRRAVEQRRDNDPQCRLRECRRPEDDRRSAAQKFNDQGNVMHWPARGKNQRVSNREAGLARQPTQAAAGNRLVGVVAKPELGGNRCEGSAVMDRGAELCSARNVPVRCNPCAARSRNPDGPGRAASSAGRVSPWRRSMPPRSTRPRHLRNDRLAVATAIDFHVSIDEYQFRLHRQAFTARASAHSEARSILSRSIRAMEPKAIETCAVAQIFAYSFSRWRHRASWSR